MKHLLLILSFTLGLTTVAQAGFVNNRDAWEELTDIGKRFYIMGAFDDMMVRHITDDDVQLEYKNHIEQCTIQHDVSAITLADMVDNYYQDVENWTLRPRYALKYSLLKFCKL